MADAIDTEILNASNPNLGNKTSTNDDKKKKKQGHRRVDVEGTVTYKKKSTMELQRAIQIGVNTCMHLNLQQPDHDILLRDFTTIQTFQFPPEGSQLTPTHDLSEYRFSTYAGIAFRKFRSLFCININEFIESLCNKSLRELSNPGASGSIFYITDDDEFILKTVQHKEASFLQKLLPEYYINLMQNKRTLLPKYYGLFCYQSMGKNIRFVIMNNILPSIVIDEKYDLKGSTFKRIASAEELRKSSPTLKDLDFINLHSEGILLESETYDALMNTIQRDCRVLESFHIMDYSLLLGIHNIDKNLRERENQRKSAAHAHTPTHSHAFPDSNECENEHEEAHADHLMNFNNNKNSESHAPDIQVYRTNQSLSSPPPPSISSTSPHEEEKSRIRYTKNPSPSQTKTSNILQKVGSPPTTPPAPAADITVDATANSQHELIGISRNATRGKSIKRIADFTTPIESIQCANNEAPEGFEEVEMDDIPVGGIPARNSIGERLILFLGIIDILQSYTIAKKMEHAWKSIFHKPDTVSVTEPMLYAQRFQDFLAHKVFKKQPPSSSQKFKCVAKFALRHVQQKQQKKPFSGGVSYDSQSADMTQGHSLESSDIKSEDIESTPKMNADTNCKKDDTFQVYRKSQN